MNRRVDVLVVGAGFHGAAVAHEAVRRGASVLLVDREDVAGGAASNALRVAHADLRHLASPLRWLETASEQRRWLREASPWLRPARFELGPTAFPRTARLGIQAGLALLERLGVARERTLPAAQRPGWWDIVVDEPERIVFALLRACASGPGSLEVLPYCGAVDLLRDDERVTGAALADGSRVEAGHVFRCVGAHRAGDRPVLSVSLVLPPLGLVPTGATGALWVHPDDERQLCIVDWRDHTLVGSFHRDYPLEARRPFRLRSEWVVEMLRWLAPVHPRFAALDRHDVKLAQAAVRPRVPEAIAAEPALSPLIESRAGGTDVMGVGWSTAWRTASAAVSHALGELPSAQKRAWVPLSELAPGAPRSGEEAFQFAVESEWATRLEDVLLRRLSIAATGHPGVRRVEAASVLLQPLLDWSERERLEQVEAFHELPCFVGNVPD